MKAGIGSKSLKEILEGCSRNWKVFLGSNGKLAYQPIRCHSIFCEVCRKERSALMYEVASKVVDEFLKIGANMSFLNLTMPSNSGYGNFGEGFNEAVKARRRLYSAKITNGMIKKVYNTALEEIDNIKDKKKKAFHLKMLKLGRKYLENAKGKLLKELFRGMWIIEFTYNSKLGRWHFHYHILTDLQLDVFLISAIVRRYGFGQVVDISKISNRGSHHSKVKRYMSKVLDYMTKLKPGASWAEEVQRYLYNRKLYSVIGMEIEEPVYEKYDKYLDAGFIRKMDKEFVDGIEGEGKLFFLELQKELGLKEGSLALWRYEIKYLPWERQVIFHERDMVGIGVGYIPLKHYDMAGVAPREVVMIGRDKGLRKCKRTGRFFYDAKFYVIGQLHYDFETGKYYLDRSGNLMELEDYMYYLRNEIDGERMRWRWRILRHVYERELERRVLTGRDKYFRYKEYGDLYDGLFVYPVEVELDRGEEGFLEKHVRDMSMRYDIPEDLLKWCIGFGDCEFPEYKYDRKLRKFIKVGSSSIGTVSTGTGQASLFNVA